MKRLLAVILMLCLLLCSLTGCEALIEIMKNRLENPGLEQLPPKLTYELTQQKVDAFYALLAETEDICITAETLEPAEAKLEELDDSYLWLIDQYHIAYINYCIDQTDETQKQLYMDCVELTAQAETAYNDMCKRVYLSDTPIRNELFADWTQDEIDRMLKRNGEIEELEKRNEEITVAYRDLEEDSAWSENMVALYNELVQNNTRIAQIYGYDSYYEYAYHVIYDRDYEQEQVALMRQYVAGYLPETYVTALEVFGTLFNELDVLSQETVIQLLYAAYDEMDENYVMEYIRSAPETMQAGMLDMFEDNRAVFTGSAKSYEGAFTTWIGEKPFCFFGPDYAGSMTLTHELGHYYGISYAEDWSQPMDLSETQSQGNEWLFTRFLEQYVSADAYETMVEYKLLSDMGNLICFVMIDQFEQQVYADPKERTQAEYEAIMEEIAQSYGGMDFITENIMDIQQYWKYVVLESPVYYISYAVSGVSALNLFAVAEQDLEEAFRIYIRLIEEPQEGEGFLGNIRYAGLTGPFEETVYRQLHERYVNS